jgi:tryptophan-rich sensory protein
MLLRFLLFLVLNFGALALGSWLMGGNPGTNSWYQQLDKAPWTPPGWVFGAAWFSIMLLFSFFMTNMTSDPATRRKWIVLFTLQFLLNISWNPIFFRWHLILPGFLILALLQVILLIMLRFVPSTKKRNSWLLVPYIIWLFVALSLNAWPLG